MPGGVLDDDAAQHRPQERPQQRRNRHDVQNVDEHGARIGAQDDQTPYGHQEGPPDSLDDAARRHHGDGGGEGAQQGPRGENGDGEEKSAARAQLVGYPSGGRYQDADGKHVGRHQGVKLQRVAVEAAGDGGDGRVQDGGIQHLHEECRCHKKGQVAQRFGGCRQFFHGRPPPVSGWAAPGARQMFVPALPLFSWRPEPLLCPGLRFTAWAVPVRAAPARVWKAMRAQVRHKASGTRRPRQCR